MKNCIIIVAWTFERFASNQIMHICCVVDGGFFNCISFGCFGGLAVCCLNIFMLRWEMQVWLFCSVMGPFAGARWQNFRSGGSTGEGVLHMVGLMELGL